MRQSIDFSVGWRYTVVMKSYSELTRDELKRMIVEQQRRITELQDINKLFMADLQLNAAIKQMRVLKAQLRIAMEVGR